jgi:hypothetical protein
MPLLAYLDPGSGSMLLQVLLAGVLAIPFFFRRVISDGWHRIRGERAATKPTEGGEDASTDRR